MSEVDLTVENHTNENRTHDVAVYVGGERKFYAERVHTTNLANVLDSARKEYIKWDLDNE